ncbi:hypothetical protein DPMN_133479 [Dreissena polymorpha]|uniref:Uncharacterized protein n=1 Tax=Dreissena polymorpha TaxID=45954 RepID=A0A9D4FXZ7_DREPO|nr:hypothetical protein DPMN_133479 [Dreissena polymorpha]
MYSLLLVSVHRAHFLSEKTSSSAGASIRPAADLYVTVRLNQARYPQSATGVQNREAAMDRDLTICKALMITLVKRQS